MSEKEPSQTKAEEYELPDRLNFDQQIEYFDKYPERITPRGLNNFCYRFDKFFRKYVKMDLLIRDTDLDEETANSIMSEKKLEQTGREFYEALDKAAKDLGVEFKEPPQQDDPRLIPIYLELRKQGYTHYDLVS